MLAVMKVNGQRAPVGNPQYSQAATIGPNLTELGISKDQSSRWQKLAAIPEDKFELAVAAAKEVAGEVTTAAMLLMKANRQRAGRRSNLRAGPAREDSATPVTVTAA